MYECVVASLNLIRPCIDTYLIPTKSITRNFSQEVKMPQDGRCAVVKIIIDIVILLVVGFPILIFHLSGRPYHRGFFCDDDSIRYPFRPSTVTNNVLYLVGIFLPVITISANEFYAHTRNRYRNPESKSFTLMGRKVPPVAWEIYKQIGVFLFGACVSQLTTDVAKYSIGRLRPHFIDVCGLNLNTYCNQSNIHAYVDKYTCEDENASLVREARLSFPSGHSSFSAYTMFYLVFYLQGCMSVKGNKLLKPFLQFTLILMTWSCALSRISDYKHHWSDVMIGFLLGAIVAAIIVYFVSDIFCKPKRVVEEASTPRNTIGNAPVNNYSTMEMEQQH